MGMGLRRSNIQSYVLNLTQVTEGPFLKQAGQSLFIWTSNDALDIGKGIINETSDTLLELTGASGSGVIATLTFTVLSAGTSQISFGSTTLDSSTNLGTINNPQYQQISCTPVNAQVTVAGLAAHPPLHQLLHLQVIHQLRPQQVQAHLITIQLPLLQMTQTRYLNFQQPRSQ